MLMEGDGVILLLEAVLPYALGRIGKRLVVESLQIDLVVVCVPHGFDLEVCASKRVGELGDGWLLGLWYSYSVKDESMWQAPFEGVAVLGQTYAGSRR